MKKSKRTIKNVVMVLMIVAIGVGSYFTMDLAKSSSVSTTSQAEMQMPSGEFGGGIKGGETQNSDSNSENFSAQPPEMPSGETSDSSNQPPEPPSGENFDSSNQPPEMPSGDNSDSSNQPPAMPDDEINNFTNEGQNSSSDSSAQSSSDSAQSSSDTSKSNSKSSSDNSQNSNSSGKKSKSSSSSSNNFSRGSMKGRGSSSSKLKTIYYFLFGFESFLIALILMYLIMSHFNKKSFKETFKNTDKILIYALSATIAASALTVSQSVLATKFASKNSVSYSQRSDMKQQSNQTNVSASGATLVDGKEETLSSSYSSSKSDESAVLVSNGGNAKISGASIEKSGDSTNTENSEFYGVNSGILVQENSSATIKNAKISTSAKGSNAVFSTGENSKIYISDSTITTSGASSARGLDATYGGYIEADSVKITTQGNSCAALATDRGEGTVIANNSTLETNGKGSPIIYSTGDISIDNTTASANGSQMVVIEGKNSASVTNSSLIASGAGNRNNVDNSGIMIYQSMSGDASEGTGTFSAASSSLSIDKNSDYYKTAPMFFVTNTDAVINLNDTKLSFGSGVLLSAKATDEWGKQGSNGANVALNAKNQELKGNIEVDNISSASISLTKSTFEGTINGENSAKEISLKLDKDSKITLTGDSYVTSLDNADSTNSNINFNGFKLYVNGKAIN
ncbi:MAG: hypothetical protein IKN26_04145 [Eubacterium sp.]|nr:hypothetical protein [Eubacterium sp.]